MRPLAASVEWYPSVGFRSWSRFLAVSLQMTWVINPAVGCQYFPPGLQLPSQPLRGLLLILLLGEQSTMGVNGLPKTARHRCNCDLNPGPSATESSTLTTRLPSHPRMLNGLMHKTSWQSRSDVSRSKRCAWIEDARGKIWWARQQYLLPTQTLTFVMSDADLPRLSHKVRQTEQEGCSPHWRDGYRPQAYHQGSARFSLVILRIW